MRKQYVTFVPSFGDVPQGTTVKLTIRDLTPGPRKYDSRIVKAILADSPKTIPEGDVLWLRSLTGVLNPRPWGIKIVGEAGEYIKKPPFSELIETVDKG